MALYSSPNSIVYSRVHRSLRWDKYFTRTIKSFALDLFRWVKYIEHWIANKRVGPQCGLIYNKFCYVFDASDVRIWRGEVCKHGILWSERRIVQPYDILEEERVCFRRFIAPMVYYVKCLSKSVFIPGRTCTDVTTGRMPIKRLFDREMLSEQAGVHYINVAFNIDNWRGGGARACGVPTRAVLFNERALVGSSSRAKTRRDWLDRRQLLIIGRGVKLQSVHSVERNFSDDDWYLRFFLDIAAAFDTISQWTEFLFL